MVNTDNKLIRRLLALLLAFLLLLSDFTVFGSETEAETETEAVSEEQVYEEPAADESVTEEPAAEESVTEEPVTEESVSEEFSLEEPVFEVPAADADELNQEELAVEEENDGEPMSFLTMSLSGSHDTSELNLADYESNSQNLDIYSYLTYTDSTGNIQSHASSSSFKIYGETNSANVVIGGRTGGSSSTAPVSQDISVQLNGIYQTYPAEFQVLDVNPNYPGNNITNIAVTGLPDNTAHTENKIENLTIDVGAHVDLTISQNITIDTLTISLGAQLIIKIDSGKTLRVGTVNGPGSLILLSGGNPAGSVYVSNEIAVGNLNIGTQNESGAAVSGASTASIYATTGSCEMFSGSVSGVKLFGYAGTASGPKTLSLGVGSVTDVLAVGVADTNINVQITVSNPSNSVSGASFIYNDYTLTYDDNSGTALTDPTWPVTYRVETDVSDGTHTVLNTSLPTYNETGYLFRGWLIDTSTTPETALPDQSESNLTLHLKQEAGVVAVTFDLDYTPDDSTNDRDSNNNLPQEITTATYSFGTGIALTDPDRFGYDFCGWKITADGNDVRTLPAGTSSFIVQATDLASDQTVTLVATWQIAGFPLKLQPLNGTLSGSEGDYHISVGNGFSSISEFASNNSSQVTWDGSTLSFSQYIEYGESLGDYFGRVFGAGSYPVLLDTRSVNDGKTRFLRFTTLNGTDVSETSTFDMDAQTGMLDSRQTGETLAAYQQSLSDSPFGLKSSFSSSLLYNLTTDTLTDWSVLVNGVVQTPDASGVIADIPANSTVTYRRAIAGTTSISSWYFTGDSRIFPTMRAVSAGDAYVYFDFTMPFADVTADYIDPAGVYMNITLSSITMAQGCSYNGLTGLKGFWYDSVMTQVSYTASTNDVLNVNAMTYLYTADFDSDGTDEYFYEFDWTNVAFHVTSCDAAGTQQQASQNQLIVIAETKGIYFCDVNLQATAAYLADFNGTKIGTTNIKNLTSSFDLIPYGNLLLNLSGGAYTSRLYFSGEHNIIASITSDRIGRTTTYNADVYIKGINNGSRADKLSVDLIMAQIQITINDNITVEELNINLGGYGLYLRPKYTSGELYFRVFNATLNMPSKQVYANESMLRCRNANFYCGQLTLSGFYECYSSIVHIYGDASIYSGETSIHNSSKITVEGSLCYFYPYLAGVNMDTGSDGYLIVKGNRLHMTTVRMYSGILIANVVEIGLSCELHGGTMITNQLIGSTDTNYSAYKVSTAPFYLLMSKISEQEVYSFTGTNIYLFGYYQTKQINSNTYYNDSISTQTAGNPIKTVIDRFIADGNSVANIDDTFLQSVLAGADCSTCTTNECVMLGDPATTADTVDARSVEITGGSIKAAGNVTFWNDTTVSGGTITCGGNFGSLRDLAISGGTITANEIGIAGDYTYTDSTDRLLRYQTLTLSGGTLTADRLGCLNTPMVGQSTSRGTVLVTGSTSITPRTASAVQLVDALKADYVYDDDIFSNPTTNPDDFIFSASLTGNSLSSISGLGLAQSAAVTLASPVVTADSTTGDWCIDSLSGTVVSSVATDGRLNGQGTDYLYENRNKAPLYAVKQQYTLKVKEGLSSIIALDYNGNPNHTDPTQVDPSYSVSRGEQVSFTVKYKDLYKVIVCYRDENGVIHNQLPAASNYDTVNNTVTFTMPAHEAEIYVTDEYSIHLNYTDIALTSDGFAVSLDANRPADSVFVYDGNIVIDQDNIISTSFILDGSARSYIVDQNNSYYQLSTDNIVSVESGGGDIVNNTGFLGRRTNNAGRTVTFTRVIMLHNNDRLNQILVASDVSEMTFYIDGAVRLHDIKANCADFRVHFIGKHRDCAQDSVVFTYSIVAWSIDIATFDFLTCTTSSGGVCTSSRRAGNGILYTNCRLYYYSGYYQSIAFSSFSYIAFEDSIIEPAKSDGYSSRYLGWNSITDLYLTRTTVYDTVVDNGFYSCGWMLTAKVANVIMDDSTYYYTENSSGNNIYRRHSNEDFYNSNFTLKNNSHFYAQHQVSFSSLTLENQSSLSFTDGAGYLLCPLVTINGSASLTADYVLLSGYNLDCYETQAIALKALEDGSVNLQGGTTAGLTINGNATVTANEFVGGNISAHINVNGGTLNAPVIGANGKIYSTFSTVPTATAPDVVAVYEPDGGVTTSGPVINITGGTVNVGEDGYLGGMNATITQSGGTVNLADGATYGMTSAQTTTLSNYYSAKSDSIENHTNTTVTVTGGSVTANGTTATGSISSPYGTVTISEATGSDTVVQVNQLMAEGGEIHISDAADGLTNPYSTAHPLDTTVSQTVGVLVADELSAAELYSSDNASVYANEAYSISDTNGYIDITDDALSATEHTALYCGSTYGGQNGTGSCTMTSTVHEARTDTMKQNLYGSKRVQIRYVLNEDTLYSDGYSVVNPATNPTGYTVGDKYTDNTDYYPLSAATRYGYDFGGWYEFPDFSDEHGATTLIDMSTSGDKVLYAKWTPKTVDFTVSVDTSFISGYSTTDWQEETAGIAGSWDSSNTVFTFSKVVSVPYGGVLLGAGTAADQVHLSNYDLNTYALTALEWRYNGTNTYVSTSSENPTVVNQTMLDAYTTGGDQPLTLFGQNKVKNRSLITLYLNVKNSLPKNAAFPGTVTTDYEKNGANYVGSYVDFGYVYTTGKGLDNGSGQLIQATAPGYSFTEWNSKSDGSGTAVAGTETVSLSSPTFLYAQWSANSYLITFDADAGAVVKTGSSEPAGGETQTLTATAVYDQILNGGLTYSGDTDTNLPTAWKEGYVFLGWSADSGATLVSQATKLNLDSFPGMDVSAASPNSALTLTAVYRKVKITYFPNGGTWKSVGTGTSKVTVDTLDYGDPLAGYVKNPAAADSDHELYGTDTRGTDSYSVVSSTNSYFTSNNKTYVTDDYRNVIGRKGYTFQGWHEAGDTTPVGTVPQYSDIILYADWQANSYTLNLYDKETGVNDTYADFAQTAKTPNPASVVTGVTVGQEIRDDTNASVSANWPLRSEWYCYNKGTVADDSTKRYLLGFTFDALDPGDTRSGYAGNSVYAKYAQDVTLLLNKQSDVFIKAEGSTSGSVFSLPADSDYDAYIGVSNVNAAVPDYPNGCTIDMYALYRERSLVFVEHVKDVNGNSTDKILASYPYASYVNYDTQYPTDTNGNYSTYTSNGYTLLKWGINSYDISADEYNSTNYSGANIDTYKNDATNLGTYDINVYTIYAAQVTDNTYILRASSNPKNSQVNYDSKIYQVPGSMQTGYVRYLLSGTGYTDFAIVSKADLLAHEYDVSYAHKIALTISIQSSQYNNKLGETDLTLTSSETLLGTNVQVSAGDYITLKMYHTRVMTADETETLNLQCKFYSNSGDVSSYLSQYFKLDNMQTVLTPSKYTVHYKAELPQVSYLNVTDYHGFDESTVLQDVATDYGSALLSAMPDVKGYDASANWTRTDSSWAAYSPAQTVPVSGGNLSLSVSSADDGEIYLLGNYTVHEYTLTLPADVRSWWNVTIDGTAAAVDSNNQVKVPYHSDVVFSGTQPGSYAEFIQVTQSGSSMTELDLCSTAGTGNTYSFTMPAADVDTDYCRLKELYLEDGTVTLDHGTTPGTGFTQGTNAFRQWRGDYAIMMNSTNATATATANRLILSGDFSDTAVPQTIYLGNLNISSANSIDLQANTTATLYPIYAGANSDVTAKNIKVDSGSSLSITGGSGTLSEFNLNPNVGDAAIGGSSGGANGTIELTNLSIDMNLPAAVQETSNASGIGAGSKDGTLTGCGTVTLTGCKVTATENKLASGRYAGSWIGGTAVPSVTIDDCTIDSKSGASALLGPYIAKGQTVTIKDSDIGQTNAVLDPIYAENSLTIVNSSISQSIQTNLGSVSAIGTGSSGTVTVKNASEVLAEFQGGDSDELYTGKLLLDDAASEVTIHKVHILEAANGDVTISQTGSTQNSQTHSHTDNYLLIQEKSGYSNDAELKVTGQNANTVIMINAMTLQKVEAQSDAALQLEGDVTVTDAVDIGSAATLDVTATGHTLTLTSGFLSTAGHGSYKQTGGTLAGSNLCVAGDMTLDTVTCNAGTGNVGSTGANGVTTVALTDCNITAANIGALGAQNSTFTFVTLSGTNTIEGTLVQDFYRLEYICTETDFDLTQDASNNALPTVLRGQTDYTAGTAGTTAYYDAVPNAPKYTGAGGGDGGFRTWYMINSSSINVAISSTAVIGFSSADQLDDQTPASAKTGEVTSLSDGTEQLKLYACISASGKSEIQKDAYYGDMGSIGTSPVDTISIETDGAFTARFELSGTKTNGSYYQLKFTNQIPADTKLTLCKREDDGTLAWYSYSVPAAATIVSLNSFTKAGDSSTTASLPAVADGANFDETLQLIVDFKDTTASANSLKLQMSTSGTVRDIMGTSLSYTVFPKAAASITASGAGVTVSLTQGSDTRLNGKHLYAVAVLKQNGQSVHASYNATASLGSVSGDWLGGDTVMFDLGSFGDISLTDTVSFSGLDAGTYSIQWSLTAADANSTNPYDRILSQTAASAGGAYTQTALTAPSMTAVLPAATSDVLDYTGNDFTVSYTVSSNTFPVKYWVEKQTGLKLYSTVGTVQTISADGTVNVTIPAAKGVYRVRFSIADNSDWDDVYSSFIVK